MNTLKEIFNVRRSGFFVDAFIVTTVSLATYLVITL